MNLEKLKQNKFFDKLLIVRADCNLQYMIDQLRECLESESVVLNKDEVLQLLDIFIRCLSDELRFDSNKELQPMYVMIGSAIKVNTESDKFDILRDYIKNVNDISPVKFSDDVLNNIIDNINIVYKEFAIFINELFDTIVEMYNSINTDHNTISFTGIIRSKNNKRFSIIYTPFKGLDRMVFIIQSNIITNSMNQDTIHLVEESFNKDEKFNKYLEKITKNQTL